MKKMTCKQLGGACDLEFQADTWEEMSALSKAHGMEMFQKGDEAHLNAMKAIKEKMTNPEVMQEWMDARKKEFDGLDDF